MQIFVRNFIRSREANLALSAARLHVIGGRNGAGKTSVLDAIECALTGQLFPSERGITRKVDAKFLINRDAKKASVRWLNENSEPGWDLNLKIAKTTQDIESTGRPPVYDSVLLGRSSLFRMKQHERIRYLSDMLEITPTLEDLLDWLKERGMTKIGEKAMNSLREDLANHGWDATCDMRKDIRRLSKSEWERVTGVPYGDTKAEDWEPGHGLPVAMKNRTIEEYDYMIAERRAELEEAQKQVGIDEGRRQALQAEAEQANDLKTQARRAQRDAQAIQAEIDEINGRLSELPQIEGGWMFSCPHCDEPLEVLWRKQEPQLRVPGSDSLSEAERKKALEKRAEIERERDEAMSRLKDATDAANRLHVQAERAERCKAELEANEGKKESGEILQQPRARYEEAKLAKAAFVQWKEASFKHRKIKALSVVIEGLSPDGVRAEVIGKALNDVNASIAAMAKVLELDPPPVILPDGGLQWDDAAIPYPLLSHSHRLRMDVMVGMALQIARGGDHPRIILMDELEAVSKDDRLKIMRAIMANKFTGVLAQVADRREAIPSTAKMAPHGIAYWMDDGVMEEI